VLICFLVFPFFAFVSVFFKLILRINYGLVNITVLVCRKATSSATSFVFLGWNP
jgi:hypothetical protein